MLQKKIDAPVVNSLFSNIVAALPFKQNAPVTPAPQPLQEVPVVATQTPATDDMPTQSPTVAPLVAPATPPALVACKANDSTCLLQAAATCNPATEQNTTSTTSPKETSSRFYAIIGIQNNQCTFTFSVKSDSVKANTGKEHCVISHQQMTLQQYLLIGQAEILPLMMRLLQMNVAAAISTTNYFFTFN